MFQGIPDLHRLRLFAPCIPLSGYVRFSPRERRAFTDGFPAVQNGLYEIQRGITSLSQVCLFRPDD